MRNPLPAWLAAVALAVGALFVAGGPAVGSHGILYAATGLLLLVFRPVNAAPPAVAVCALGLLGWCALAFLPVSLAGAAPWRQMLESQGQMRLGPWVTPQPFHTLAGLGMLASALGFLLFLLTQPANDEQTPLIARCFASGIGFYAAAAIFCAHTGSRYPWSFDEKTFGFLANKNHTGTVLVVGALVAVGSVWHDLTARRPLLALPAAASLVAIGAAVFGYCDSRGSALLLPVGLLGWFGGLLRSHLDRRAIISAAAVIAVTLGLFLTSSTPARERLAALAGRAAKERAESATQLFSVTAPKENADATLEFRTLIYRDTLPMLRAAPLLGVGLGNFRYVFPQYRNLSRTESQCLHPESSYFQLAAEAGLPALLIALGLLGVCFWRLRRHRERSTWPLHWALAVAVLMVALHCLFDVPGSRLGSLWPALLVAGMAFGEEYELPTGRRSRLIQSILFAILGVCMVAVGARLIQAEWSGDPLPGPSGAFRARQQAHRLYQENKVEEAIAITVAAARVTPLDPDLYFLRGALELRFTDTEPLVDDLFATERMLQPTWALVPLRQGVQWLAVDETRALPLLAEALARADRMPPGSQYRSPLAVFLSVLDAAPVDSPVFAKLLTLVEDRPPLVLEWLQRFPDPAVAGAIDAILARSPSLENWDARARLKLFRRWYRLGDRAALLAALEKGDAWRDAAWPILATDLARGGRFEEACAAVAQRMKISLELPPASSTEPGADTMALRSRFEEQGSALAAERLMEAYLREENPPGALRVADEAAARRAASPRVALLTAIAARQSGAWDRAWRAMQLYVQQVEPALTPE